MSDHSDHSAGAVPGEIAAATDSEEAPSPPTGSSGFGRIRPVVAGIFTVLAFVLVMFALVAPNRTEQLTPTAFVRLPVDRSLD